MAESAKPHGGLRTRPSSRTNFFLMIGGFLAGQGTLFLAQTHLILTSRFELAISFTLAFAVSSLAAMLIDMGGTTLLARRFVVDNSEAENNPQTNRYYVALVAVRLVAWAVVSVATLSYWHFGGGKIGPYLVPAILALVFWCFNVAGLLDGMRLSGLAGVSSGLPHVFSALALVLTSNSKVETALLVCGISFGLGSIATVIFQLACARSAGFTFKKDRPSFDLVRSTLRESLQFQYCFLPGQIAYRAQIVLAEAVLSVSLAALLVYGKQAASALLQLIAFMRRISFPTLVHRLSSYPGQLKLKEVIRIQRGAIILTVALVGGIWVARFVQVSLGWEWANDIAYAISITSPIVLSTSVFGILVHCLHAQGRYVTLGTATIAAAAVSIAGAYALHESLGILAFVLAEVVGHALVLVPLWLTISRPRIKGLFSISSG